MHLEERGCERGTHKADGIALNKSNYQHSILLTTNVGIARIRADSSGDQVLSGVAWKSRLGQVRPSFGACTVPSGSSFDGTNCVSSAPSSNGEKYTVTFPTAGNYKLVCLVHANMNGAVHVLPASMSLPHTQSFYDTQASDQAKDLINDADGPLEEARDFGPGANAVVMHGEIKATAK